MSAPVTGPRRIEELQIGDSITPFDVDPSKVEPPRSVAKLAVTGSDTYTIPFTDGTTATAAAGTLFAVSRLPERP